MKLTGTITVDEISAALREQSERSYGSERTAELAATIDATAAAMARIAAKELALREASPEISSPDGRGSR